MEHIPFWAIALIWVVFLLYTWMVSDVVRALMTYLRAKRIKTTYEITILHNQLAEYSEKIKKEHPEAFTDGCRFHGAPEDPPVPPNA